MDDVSGSPARKAAFAAASSIARSVGDPCVTVEHVLLASTGDFATGRRLGEQAVELLREAVATGEHPSRITPSPTTDLLDVMHAPGDGSLNELVDGCLARTSAQVRAAVADRAPPPSLDAARGYRAMPAAADYAVRLHDDDTTPMAFVVGALESTLVLRRHEALYLMYLTHQSGHSDCGAYSLEEAHRLASEIIRIARKKGHSLHVTVAKRSPTRVAEPRPPTWSSSTFLIGIITLVALAAAVTLLIVR